MNDKLTVVSEERLRELLELEKELQAAREVAYFSQILIDSVVRDEDGDVTIGSLFLDMLKCSLEKIYNA